MAITRFDSFLPRDYRISVPNIKPFLPNFKAWDEALAQQQLLYDNTMQVAEKVPDHLQQDAGIAQQYMAEVQGDIDNLTSLYRDSGVAVGNRERSKLIRSLRKDWQPGGAANVLQQRKALYNAHAKKIDDFYKDDPDVADYLKGQIQVSPFNESFGSDSLGINAPTLNKVFSPKETQDLIGKALDNISADQIVSPIHRSKVKGMSFKQLQSRKMTKFIDWNKAAIALSGSIPPELIQSFDLKGRAQGLTNQGDFLARDSEGKVLTDDKGNIQFNPESSLGRLVNAAVTGKVFNQESVKDSVLTDTYGIGRSLAKFKHDLDKEPFDGFDRSRPANLKSFNMKKLSDKGIKVEKGKIILEGVNTKKVRAGEGTKGKKWNGTLFRTFISLDNPDEIRMNSPELANMLDWAEARGIFDNIKIDTKGKTKAQIRKEIDDTKMAIIAQEIERTENNFTGGIQFNSYSPKRKKEINEVLFNRSSNKAGKLFTQGISGDRVMRDTNTGEIINAESLKELEDENGGLATATGEVGAVQSLAPFGSVMVNIGDKQFIVDPRLSDQVKPENYLNALYMAKHGTRTIPLEREFPDGVQLPGTSNMLPSGTYRFTYAPDEDDSGNLTGYHIVERKQGKDWVKILEHENFDDVSLNHTTKAINPNGE